MYPRLVENLWTVTNAGADVTTLDGVWHLPPLEAVAMLSVRSHCTGFNDLEMIAARSGQSLEVVEAVVTAFKDASMIASPELGGVTLDEIRERFVGICKLWSIELARDFIPNRLMVSDKYPVEVLIGWLVEMHHYVQQFPILVSVAADAAGPDSPLRPILQTYANQEVGHEQFVLNTLERLGVTADEVGWSEPMLSTVTVRDQILAAVSRTPEAMLLIAALVEASECNTDAMQAMATEFSNRYGIAPDALDPYFEHQRIDHDLGHAELLNKHLDLLFTPSTQLSRVNAALNGLHNVKHAFDLQTLEILDAYGNGLQGRYFPRQTMELQSLIPTSVTTEAQDSP